MVSPRWWRWPPLQVWFESRQDHRCHWSIEDVVASQSWKERNGGWRAWENFLAYHVVFLWLWDVWSRNQPPGSDGHRSSACAMAVDFIVGYHREAKNVSRKFSSGLNLQRRTHSWHCNQNCLSNTTVASCCVAKLDDSTCSFLLQYLNLQRRTHSWHCNQNCLSNTTVASCCPNAIWFQTLLLVLQPELSEQYFCSL